MTDDDFYEEDDSVRDVMDAWQRGERGITEGDRRLSPEAQSIADALVAEWSVPETINVVFFPVDDAPLTQESSNSLTISLELV